MPATSGTGDKARVGEAFPTLQLTTTSGQRVAVPDADGDYVHLQLRRFAGCPICNLHLRSILTRHDEIRAHGIREVVVFHSTPAELAKYEAELPFPLIADPERLLYRQLGVERGPSSLLRGRALRAMISGQAAAFMKRSAMRGPFAPLTPTGGLLGLPADFLIAPDGRLAAVKYGQHTSGRSTNCSSTPIRCPPERMYPLTFSNAPCSPFRCTGSGVAGRHWSVAARARGVPTILPGRPPRPVLSP